MIALQLKREGKQVPFADCANCPLRHQPMVPGCGPTKTEFSIVGEGPGNYEVQRQQPFVGPSGQLLNRMLTEAGVKRDEVYVTNATLCLPTGRADKDSELAEATMCCAPRLYNELQARGVKHVLALGAYAAKALGSTDDSITKARGKRFWNANHQWVMPSLHPAYILRLSQAGGNANVERDVVWDMATWASGEEPERIPAPFVIEHTKIETLLDALRGMYHRAKQNPDKKHFVALDFETTSLVPQESRIVLGVMCDGQMTDDQLTVHAIVGDLNTHSKFIEAINHLAQVSNVYLCGHNIKYDRQVMLQHWGKDHTPIWKYDTLLAHYALDERTGGHDLKTVAPMIFEVRDWSVGLDHWLEEETKRRKREAGRKGTYIEPNYGDIPHEMLVKYAALDAQYTWLLADYFDAGMPDSLRPLLHDLLIPTQNMLAEMEFGGVPVDMEYRKQLIEMWTARIESYKEELPRLLVEYGILSDGASFKLGENGATNDVKKALIGLLGISAPVRGLSVTKTGQISTDSADLAKMRKGGPEIAQWIDTLTAFRSTTKLLGTYVEGAVPDAHGRLHSSFNLAGQVSGRPASSKPNLLNIPRASTGFGKELRPMYAAPKGRKIVVSDYSQLELRALAFYSRDPYLVDAYNQGWDMHLKTAEKLYGPISKDDLDFDRKRTVGKTTNFNFPYALGNISSTMALLEEYGIKLSQEEAAKLEAEMCVQMAGFLDWTKGITRQIITRRYVESKINGRRRRFGYTDPQNYYQVREHTKLGVNHLGQSASDLTWYAMLKMWPILPEYDAQFLLMWYDAIWLECPDRYAEELGRLTVKTLIETANEKIGGVVPFDADLKIGQHFGKLEKVK